METAPNWFSVTGRGSGVVDGVCHVIDDTATTEDDYSITIKMLGCEVYARETNLGEKLPKVCYDRHIMPDGWFCIGLDAGSSVTSEKGARDWWSNLLQFLILQGVAATTGRWPRAMELDHGQAGLYHQAALEAAKKLGISEEYELALLGQKSWMTSMLNCEGNRLMNGRAPCPMGCTRKGRRILRSDCCSRSIVLDLVTNERLRAYALAKFWEKERKDKDLVCCGTMISCPLRAQ